MSCMVSDIRLTTTHTRGNLLRTTPCILFLILKQGFNELVHMHSATVVDRLSLTTSHPTLKHTHKKQLLWTHWTSSPTQTSTHTPSPQIPTPSPTHTNIYTHPISQIPTHTNIYTHPISPNTNTITNTHTKNTKKKRKKRRYIKNLKPNKSTIGKPLHFCV